MKTKKLVSLLLTVCLLLSMMPFATAPVLAATTEGYTIYEYAATDGKQWFETGFTSESVTGLEAKVSVTSTAPAYDMWVFGGRNTNSGAYANDGWFCLFRWGATNTGPRTAIPDGVNGVTQMNYSVADSGVVANTPFVVSTYVISGKQSLQVNGAAAKTSMAAADYAHNSDINLSFFAPAGTNWSHSATYGWQGTASWMKLYNDSDESGDVNDASDLIAYYLPATSASGAVGFYEALSGNFYESQGASAFTVGGTTLCRIVPKSGYTEYYVSSAEGLDYAIDLAESGDKLVMEADISHDGEVDLPAGVTLDQNGFHLDYGSYTFVGYIINPGKAYFKTPFKTTEVSGLKAKVALSDGQSNSYDMWLFGSRNTNSGAYSNDGYYSFLRWNASHHPLQAFPNGSGLTQLDYGSTIEDNVPFEVDSYAVPGSHLFTVDGTTLKSTAGLDYSHNYTENLAFFAPGGTQTSFGYGATFQWKGYAYWMQLFRDGGKNSPLLDAADRTYNKAGNVDADIIANYIPALNGSGEAGFYDTISGNFYASNGAAQFGYGGGVTGKVTLESDGTKTYNVLDTSGLDFAVSSAVSGDKVILDGDVFVEGNALPFASGVKLDLNGNKFYCGVESSAPVYANGTTIVDSAVVPAATYTLLDYASSDGKAYFQTGISSDNVTGLKATLAVNSISPASGYDQWFFGGRMKNSSKSNAGWYCLLRNAHNSGSVGNFRSTMPSTSFAAKQTSVSANKVTANSPFDVDSHLNRSTGTKVLTVNGSTNTEATACDLTYTTMDMYLFTVSGTQLASSVAGGNYGWKGRAYNIELYNEKNSDDVNDANELIKRYIPAKDSTGEAGFYEVLSGTFYKSEGNSKFAASSATHGRIEIDASGNRTFVVTDNTGLALALAIAASGDIIALGANNLHAATDTVPTGVKIDLRNNTLTRTSGNVQAVVDGTTIIDNGAVGTIISVGTKAALSDALSTAQSGDLISLTADVHFDGDVEASIPTGVKIALNGYALYNDGYAITETATDGTTVINSKGNFVSTGTYTLLDGAQATNEKAWIAVNGAKTIVITGLANYVPAKLNDLCGMLCLTDGHFYISLEKPFAFDATKTYGEVEIEDDGDVVFHCTSTETLVKQLSLAANCMIRLDDDVYYPGTVVLPENVTLDLNGYELDCVKVDESAAGAKVINSTPEREHIETVTLLPYIETNGSQYVDTRLTTDSITGIDAKVDFGTDTDERAILAGRDGNNALWAPAMTQNGELKTAVAASELTESIEAEHHFAVTMQDGYQYQKVGVNTAQEDDEPFEDPFVAFPVNLFNFSGSVQPVAGTGFIGKIFSVKLFNDTENANVHAVRNYIPAEKNGSSGLYDLIEKRFYSDKSYNDFAHGAENYGTLIVVSTGSGAARKIKSVTFHAGDLASLEYQYSVAPTGAAIVLDADIIYPADHVLATKPAGVTLKLNGHKLAPEGTQDSATEYELLDYLTVTGRQYIDTGLKRNEVTGIKLRTTYSEVAPNGNYIFGGTDKNANGATVNSTLLYINSSNNISAYQQLGTPDTNSNRSIARANTPANVSYTLESIVKDGLQYLKAGQLTSKATLALAETPAFDLRLFYISHLVTTVPEPNEAGSYGHRGDVYWVKIYNDTTDVTTPEASDCNANCVRIYVPVKAADGTVGMFDMITGTFATPKGLDEEFGASKTTYGSFTVNENGSRTYKAENVTELTYQLSIVTAGDTIRLEKDIDCKSTFVIPAGVTLNLNGHTMSCKALSALDATVIDSSYKSKTITVTDNDNTGFNDDAALSFSCRLTATEGGTYTYTVTPRPRMQMKNADPGTVVVLMEDLVDDMPYEMAEGVIFDLNGHDLTCRSFDGSLGHVIDSATGGGHKITVTDTASFQAVGTNKYSYTVIGKEYTFEPYRLTFAANGADAWTKEGTFAETYTQDVGLGDEITFDTCAYYYRDGSLGFAGWSGDQEYAIGDKYTVTGNASFTAKWAKFSVGNTKYDTFAAANAGAHGDRINVFINVTLNSDTALAGSVKAYGNAKITVAEGKTLDLAGRTLEATVECASGAIVKDSQGDGKLYGTPVLSGSNGNWMPIATADDAGETFYAFYDINGMFDAVTNADNVFTEKETFEGAEKDGKAAFVFPLTYEYQNLLTGWAKDEKVSVTLHVTINSIREFTFTEDKEGSTPLTSTNCTLSFDMDATESAANADLVSSVYALMRDLADETHLTDITVQAEINNGDLCTVSSDILTYTFAN